jgi:hypothetical protein
MKTKVLHTTGHNATVDTIPAHLWIKKIQVSDIDLEWRI